MLLHLLMGNELGNETYIDRLIASSSLLSYTNFHPDRERLLFLELLHEFRVKMAAKKKVKKKGKNGCF